MNRHAATSRARRALIGIETVTGAAAAIGGALLIARPDGRLIGARMSALAGSPFDNWRIPGLLLLSLVGGGYLVAALYVANAGRFARALSIVAGLGLMAFEVCENVWLGFQPLEIAFMAVGLIVVLLAVGPLGHESAQRQPVGRLS